MQFPGSSYLSKDQQNQLVRFGPGLSLLVLVGLFAYFLMGVQGNIDGEYVGQESHLGDIVISLSEQGNSISGNIRYGRHIYLPLSSGRLNGDTIELSFDTPKSQADSGEFLRYINVSGKIKGGTISGTIQENGSERYPIALQKNYASSMLKEFSQ